ncbi:hypothetical protein E4T66_19910 [Sinimarinibacterium sp. CAU 1509]|uniref:hypothetical protein n=1 Tax=Sinimarinibacterium sp. CAU 1509 TaxID=2562283 RepID=UPI0010AD3D76|nr:hypothetical protein [Sinimarinibacterium sp. CAU 1509]TJY56228.1 hypothetical protein E4T66_19910 [Sinimarinibacterium sp. CAU 1509]
MSLHHRLCRIWAVVFVIAGLSFAFAPATVAMLLDALARVLGLSPGFAEAVARASLWYGLALSLMATLVYLAWQAGGPDAPPQLLNAVLLSKLASTLAFSIFALTAFSGWWLCAAADGFVGLTLIATRPTARRGT